MRPYSVVASINKLPMPAIKLISWNVNGLRAVLKKGFEGFLATEQPDVLCLQETKISDDLVQNFSFEG